MAKKHTNNIFNTQYPSGIAFIGAILVGLGVGQLKHETGTYTLIGVGVGFILVALISISTRNKFLDR
jgi:hypothetical protein